MTQSTKRTQCRSCNSPNLRIVVDFGLQPLAGYYAKTAEDSLTAARYPLVLKSCNNCDLLQITDLPPIEEVFHADYTYSSSQVLPLVEHFAEYATWLAERLPTDASILEFGCNDGVLLEQLRQRDFNQLVGVDASSNMAAAAAARGFEVVAGFFGPSIVKQLAEHAPFDLVTCSNVFAHIDDLKGVLKTARALIRDGGELCVEVHDAERLILEGQFETIYHEHLSYFSHASLQTCLALAGFSLIEIEKTSMHGGGLRARARKMSGGSIMVNCKARSDSEIETIGRSLVSKIVACRDTISKLRSEFGPLDGYGMAGRAQMFLSMTETEGAFGRLFDDASIRQGRFAVGTDIRIKPFDPDDVGKACVILAWNYAAAITPRIRDHYHQIHVLFPEIARLV